MQKLFKLASLLALLAIIASACSAFPVPAKAVLKIEGKEIISYTFTGGAAQNLSTLNYNKEGIDKSNEGYSVAVLYIYDASGKELQWIPMGVEIIKGQTLTKVRMARDTDAVSEFTIQDEKVTVKSTGKMFFWLPVQ